MDDDFQLNAKNLMTGEKVSFSVFIIIILLFFLYILGFLGRLISL